MIIKTSIKLKATFLFVVFALNTIIGFGCALGVDMGFNTKHHAEGQAVEGVVHIHKDGKKHIHHEKKSSDSHDKSHHHDEAGNFNKAHSDNNCCNDKVLIFEQVDKSVPNSLSIINPSCFIAFVDTYYNISILPNTNVVKDIKPFVRSYHPPIPDIRIAIQSFQI